MEGLFAVGHVWLYIVSGVTILFLVSVVRKRNDIADVAWGPGIFFVGALSAWLYESTTILMYVLLVLTGVWALRLSVRIHLRNRGRGEDPRYKEWRDEWGASFYPRSYLQVYVLQGTLMLFVGYPLVHTAVYGVNGGVTWWMLMGCVVWLVGFVYEVLADYQLDQHIQNPEKRGQILQSGVWRYSRHPNYFGEVTLWWGVWLMALSVPYGVWAIVGPLTITFLILKVSGVPMLEKSMASRPGYAEYAQRTSVFIPLPPKKHVNA